MTTDLAKDWRENPEREGVWVTFWFAKSSETGKTLIWRVTGSGGPKDLIGHVTWSGTWRRYIYRPNAYQATGAVMGASQYDAACLREIADFLEEQTRAHASIREAERKAKVTL